MMDTDEGQGIEPKQKSKTKEKKRKKSTEESNFREVSFHP